MMKAFRLFFSIKIILIESQCIKSVSITFFCMLKNATKKSKTLPL